MKPISKDGPVLRALLGITNGLCKTLHVPCPPVTFVTCELEAPDGTIAHRNREKANSWVRSMHNMFCLMFLPSGASGTFGEGTLVVKNTAGMSITQNATTAFKYQNVYSADKIGGDAGEGTRGIVVGSGTNDESLEDYALQSIITSGTGVGQLSYQAGILGTASYDVGTKKWSQTITRIFNNNSASPVLVNEVAIYWTCLIGGSSNAIMIDRSKLTSPVSVPAAYKLTVTYTTEYTFPA